MTEENLQYGVENILGTRFDNMTKEEREVEAIKTLEQIRTTNLKDFISLNNDTLDKALKVAISDDIKSKELKTLMLNLLREISKLYQGCETLYNARTTSFFKTVIKNQDTNVGVSATATKLDQIRYIQNKVIEHLQGNIQEGQSGVIARETAIREIVTSENIILKGCKSVQESIDEAIKEIIGFSVIEPFIKQPEDIPFDDFIEEIRVDDFNDIRIVVGGTPKYTDVSFDSPEHAAVFAQSLVLKSDQKQVFSQTNPFIRFRLGETTRVSIMRDPIATRNKKVSMNTNVNHIVIRRQRNRPFELKELIDKGSINEFGTILLSAIASNGISFVGIGGTGTGKTSMMNPFIRMVSGRAISMAEVDEMGMRDIDFNKEIIDEDGRKSKNPLYLKAKNSALMWEASDPKTKIVGDLTWFRGMFNAALTMTPSAIIIQETKGSEMTDLINAALSDHQTITTIHCTGPDVFAYRAMKMVQEDAGNTSEDILMKEIVEAFPIVVSFTRLKDGSRKIASITELVSYIPETKEIITNTLVRYEVEKNVIEDGKFRTIGSHKVYNLPSPKLMETMLRKGLLEEDRARIEIMFDTVRTTNKPKDLDRFIYNKGSR